MIALELTISSKQPGLTTAGEIYCSPLDPKQPPLVSDVIARDSRSSRFTLAPGDYSYYFHVDLGDGEFTVAVLRVQDGAPLAADDFDTKFGYHGRVFHFTVRP